MFNKKSIKQNKTVFRIIAFLACFLLTFPVCDRIAYSAMKSGDNVGTTAKYADPVDEFLSRSAFVGNSISVGLYLYNNRRDNIPLGDATMLTRESYSFVNDFKSNTPYLPRFNGTPMRAKDAIRECGAEYVFICMGTNDLVGKAGAENALANFKKYIAEILEENPGITIFVESCTPSTATSNVINSKVLAFNSYVKNYCDVYPGIHYIDVATRLSDADGYLLPEFASDGSVHLSNSAYELWVETVRSYISDYIGKKPVNSDDDDALKRALVLENYGKYLRKLDEMKRYDRILRYTSPIDPVQ